MSTQLPTSELVDPDFIHEQVVDAILRSYRDGFQAALVAVNNAMLREDADAYRALLRAQTAAEQRLAEHLEITLQGRELIG